MILVFKHTFVEVNNCTGHILNFVSLAAIVKFNMAAIKPLFYMYITGMDN